MSAMAPVIQRYREAVLAREAAYVETYDRIAKTMGWPTTAEIEAERAARWPSWSHG